MAETLTNSSSAVASREASYAAILLGAIAALTIGGAWFFQLVLGIVPCPLCLEQRYAYYFLIPLAVLIAFAASRGTSRNILVMAFAVAALAAIANALLGVYHSGVEWGFWQGPTDCTGPLLKLDSGSLLDSIKTVKVIRCDEVQWRFLGLSLAGYNVLISLAMAVVALWGARAASR
ncbi:MAG: disulfide bond formation protein B [Afipia sp.]|nr:disulfide bond formation protein B [Afipia sp.]